MSRLFGVRSLTTRSPIRTTPPLMSSRPATIRSAVVLPQPDGPTNTMNSPSTMSRSSRSTAVVPSGNCFETFSNVTLAMVLLLHCSADETPDECALREDENDRHRHDGDQRCEREFGLEDLERLASAADRRIERRRRREQVPEPDRDRVLVRVREYDVGQEEVVPVGDEAEEEDECDDRLRERQRDAHEGLQLAAAVDASGVEKPRRKCGRVVEIREVDAEREERERQDDRERAPDQVCRAQLEEDRQHERRPGHDHHDQRQRQDELPAWEPADCEPVPRRNPHGERDRGRAERVVERVDDPAAVDVAAERVQVLPGERDVVEVPEGERTARDEAVVALGRRENEPDDRRDEEDRERQQDRTTHGEPEHTDGHQSSVLKSPLRVTINTAPTRPIRSRSTAIAAAPLKSA